MAAQPRRLMAKFFRNRAGTQPVDQFIEGLPPAHQLALDRQIARLNALDETVPNLAHPYSSQIEGELRELRCHYGNVHYRILYRRSEQFFILLHIFRKTTATIPEAEKRVARERWTEFKHRMNAASRTLPSPAGKRAPRKRSLDGGYHF
jgi:phage-related protein